MHIQRVCILGGTGFVGHHLTARLASVGVRCRIITRHPQRHRDLQVLPGLELVQGNILDTDTLTRQFTGCEAVINLVGILNEPNKIQSFRLLHRDLVTQVVSAARAAGIPRYLHMSALHANAETGPSEYLRTKGAGEDLAHAPGQPALAVTSFRPSVIFGPNDSFFNRFATLLRLAPGVFPLACADARFQPVYVGDVVDAFIRTLDDRNTWNRRYNLCGPEVFTLRELVQYTADRIGRKVLIVRLNDFWSRTQAQVLQYLPGTPFSIDNYQSLQVDSVCTSNELQDLGITPHSIASQVPLYLS